MNWFERDFDHPAYFRIYQDKEAEAREEGPALATLLGLHRDSLVLDLPCGWGRLRPALAAHGYRVLGGDLSSLNLQRHLRDFPAPVARLDLRALPFRNACAEGVLCAFTSWGYFATREENLRQLQEFARVLKPRGTLLLDLTGRKHLERLVASLEDRWWEITQLGFQERVRWSPDGRRVWTDRIRDGEHFRHDIWVPTHSEVEGALEAAGFEVDEAFGGLGGGPWHEGAERWIYRALRK